MNKRHHTLLFLILSASTVWAGTVIIVKGDSINIQLHVDFNVELGVMTPKVGWLVESSDLVPDGKVIPLHPSENRFDAIGTPPVSLEGAQLARFNNIYERLRSLGVKAYPIFTYMPSYLQGPGTGIPPGPHYCPPNNVELWKQHVKDYVQFAADNNMDIAKWNVWNEYWGLTEDQYNEMYKLAWEAVKEIMPNADVVGPSNDRFDEAKLKRFMDYCHANGLTIDNFAWHEIFHLGPTYQGHLDTIKQYAQGNDSLGIKQYINEEYGNNADTHNLSQGSLVNWLAVNEDANVSSSFKSVWKHWNSLSDLLAVDENTSTYVTRRPTWWAMKAYGEMSGSRVQVKQPGNGTYAIAAKDIAKGEAKILIGNKDAGWGGAAGNLRLNLSNQPFAGSEIRIDKYRVTNTEDDGLVLQATEHPASNTDLTTVVPLANDDAWLIVIKKQDSAPGSFVLKTPDDDQVTTALPTFSWTAASGADTYHLKVSTKKDMSSPVLGQAGITATSYTLTSALTIDTKYYWTVQAVNAYGTANAENNMYYGLTVKTNVNVPGRFELRSVRHGSTGNSINPQFTWTKSMNAESYTLLIDESGDFSSPAINENTAATTYTSATGLNHDAIYFAKVVANNTNGSREMVGTPISFKTKPSGNQPGSFSLASPSNGATNIDKRSKLDWSDSNGAFFYTLEIAADGGFGNPVRVASNIITSAYTLEPDLLAPNTTYHWRVTAYDKTYSNSTVAASRSFSTEATPTSPLLKTITSGRDRKASLYFSTVKNTTSYSIKYGTSPGHYTTTITGVSGSPYTVTGLINGTTYYFAVVAVNSSGESRIFNEGHSTPSDSAPIHHWKFDGNVSDSSGSNNGTVTGTTTYESSPLGQAFSCNGSTRIDLTHFARPGQMSISAWIKTTAASGDREIVGWGIPSGGGGTHGSSESEATAR